MFKLNYRLIEGTENKCIENTLATSKISTAWFQHEQHFPFSSELYTEAKPHLIVASENSLKNNLRYTHIKVGDESRLG